MRVLVERVGRGPICETRHFLKQQRNARLCFCFEILALQFVCVLSEQERDEILLVLLVCQRERKKETYKERKRRNEMKATTSLGKEEALIMKSTPPRHHRIEVQQSFRVNCTHHTHTTQTLGTKNVCQKRVSLGPFKSEARAKCVSFFCAAHEKRKRCQIITFRGLVKFQQPASISFSSVYSGGNDGWDPEGGRSGEVNNYHVHRQTHTQMK